MQQQIINFLAVVSGWVWGVPLLVLLVGTGLFLTIRLKGVQFRLLGHSLNLALRERKETSEDAEGEISHFQALTTALAATVGTGNIAGVATAISAGGPGALFWMWITGLVGMATKYAEAVLAVRYRVKDENGAMSGGPMYYLRDGLKAKWLGVIFAVCTAVAAFGIGNMVQSNSVADVVRATTDIPMWITGVVLAVFTGLVVIGGIRSIGRVTEKLVPVMIVFYIGGALAAIIMNISEIPAVVSAVFVHAFTPHAATGGFLGATVKMAIQKGVSRGVFSNESGLGSSPIAAAAARTSTPARQALVSMTQTFIDTIIVCSLTGLAILSSGAWTQVDPESGRLFTGAPLTSLAFSTSIGSWAGGIIVTVGLVLFAYSTILGWCYYGEQALKFLAGERAVRVYRVLFVMVVALGAAVKLDLVWSFSDVMNGLMAAPNLVGLLLLSGVVAAETGEYIRKNS